MPILRLAQSNPLTDGRQSERALAIRRGIVCLLEEYGSAVLAEFPLANGRRVDLLALDRKGQFTIIEIKSSIEDFRSDSKWPDYRAYCDQFAFATAPDVPPEIFPEEEGLFIADQFGAEMLRAPVETKLAGASRKALTLRFARIAAIRLERTTQFCLEQGLDLVANNSADTID